MSEEGLAALARLGITGDHAIEANKNNGISNATLSLVGKYGDGDIPSEQATVIFSFATKIPKSKALTDTHVDTILASIKKGDLTRVVQLDAAIAFFKKNKDSVDGYEEACGFGIVITPEDITTAVAAEIEKVKDELVAKRYRFSTGPIIASLRKSMKWADAKAVKDEIDAQVLALLGPKTEEDMKKPPKVKNKSEKPSVKDTKVEEKGEDVITFTGASSHFHAVGGNDTTANYVTTPNTTRLLAEHKKRVNNTVHTRFPPEPNGILHIGHAKAINFNFKYAKGNGGNCYLRYDDTNPEKEGQEFVDGILTDVRWLGYEPFKITYSSDYFVELHEAAVELIKRGGAYVCHQPAEELKGHEDRKFSPWRERPIEESLKLFDDMKKGLIDEGKATLRMKHIMEDGKLDPVAYRIMFAPHHRTGNTWCIYPTYDFTHCLCDSFEDITHSLCTKEFQNRRSSYYWLCNSLDVYCPVQWEYSRLNMAYALVSKRKIGNLIDTNTVRGWDDPRLFTLAALRRRGFPPEAVNNFCALVGVTENNNTLVSPKLLEACVRDVLNVKATRVMAVLDPLKVTITSGDYPSTVTVENNAVVEGSGTHAVPLCSVLYIDRDDFCIDPPKGYRRLTPTQSVCLKAAGLVLHTESFKTGSDGRATEVSVRVEALTKENKPKGFIHWVSSASPEKPPRAAEVNVFHQLFNTENPLEGKDMKKNVNLHSLDVFDALIDDSVDVNTVGTVYQFERIGFFVVDKESTPELPVFNRTVALKEDKGKTAK
eukprot:m.135083 g.135083  ORF g.135083 m.135083 type:complete len:768 (+) comp9826_c0_seq1:21-2324(+)